MAKKPNKLISWKKKEGKIGILMLDGASISNKAKGPIPNRFQSWYLCPL